MSYCQEGSPAPSENIEGELKSITDSSLNKEKVLPSVDIKDSRTECNSINLALNSDVHHTVSTFSGATNNYTGNSDNAIPNVVSSGQPQAGIGEKSRNVIDNQRGTEPEIGRDNELLSAGVNGSSIFPAKLHRILTDGRWKDIIGFKEDGDGHKWKVIDKTKLQEQVLPVFFRHSNYLSFTRSVVDWGFNRCGKATYYHKLFVKDSPRLCLEMCRKSVPKKKKQNAFGPEFNTRNENVYNPLESIHDKPSYQTYSGRHSHYNRNYSPPSYEMTPHPRFSTPPINCHENTMSVMSGPPSSIHYCGGNTPPCAYYHGSMPNMINSNVHHSDHKASVTYGYSSNFNIHQDPSYNTQYIPCHGQPNMSCSTPPNVSSHGQPNVLSHKLPNKLTHTSMQTQTYPQIIAPNHNDHSSPHCMRPANVQEYNNYRHMGSNAYDAGSM